MSEQVTVAILAGGQGRRFGGQDKGLVEVSGTPLIELIIEQLRAETANIVINANRNKARYQQYGYPVIEDTMADYQGPLAGFASVMTNLNTEFLLTLPCDAPKIPEQYVSKMMQRQQQTDADIVVASDGERLQPVHALIANRLLPSLMAFLARGERKIDRWYAEHNMAALDFSDTPDVFHNLNTEQQKLQLEAEQSSKPALKKPIDFALPLIGFAAFSGVGKTTLIKNLLPKLRERGLRVGMIKHAHHALDIDHPGKDSYELRKAGAEQMLVVSRSQVAWVRDLQDGREEPDLQEALDLLDPDSLDLVLVEGFKRESFSKIELHRDGLHKPLLYPEDSNIIAFASEECPDKLTIPWIDLNQIDEMAEFIVSTYQEML
ncbi:molybdenum cofactor guanylyltransferase MobA [Leucothrix pacifica]|uniref:Molybdenum cofactor guanylyltransferase n=1 Tax=Leucothrix pacifica TaxID=1247513 RepID=A0A317CBZ8_9GAMM|nr:molybdenum cofactor guanylyltransferase MobA [Leucothrix pacifica]PWQ96076.1 molybdenum cofactor guanylyltransferase [Leucothrix pacifica]